MWPGSRFLAQSPGGIAREANELSKAADRNNIQPLVIVAGLLILIVVAVVIVKMRKE
jgi:hypothetical protein